MLDSEGEVTEKQDRLEALFSVFMGPGCPWRLLLLYSPGVQVIQNYFFCSQKLVTVVSVTTLRSGKERSI